MLPKVLTRLTSKSPAASVAVNAAAAAPETRARVHASEPVANATRPDAQAAFDTVPLIPVNAIGPILTEPSIHDEVEAGYDVRRELRTQLERDRKSTRLNSSHG